MLGYLSKGERRYGCRPLYRYSRGAVEFQVVLSGHARPVSLVGEARKVPAPRLWVHGQDSDHGWTDDPGGVSRIVVFHFDEVRPVLLRALHKESPLSKPLTARDVSRVLALYRELLPHARRFHQTSPVWMDKACAELTLMALAGMPEERLRDPDRHAEAKVAQATAWYRSRIAEAPTLCDVARAVSVSPPHLRRLFRQAKNAGPHEVFHEIRMSAGLRMLREGTLRISEISNRLGFSEPSAFTRAFRKQFGQSPSVIPRRRP